MTVVMMMFITSEDRSAPPHTTHTQTQVARGGTRGDHQGPAIRGSLRIISGAWWDCSTARSAGLFVGTSSAEDDNEDITGWEKRSPLHLARK